MPPSVEIGADLYPQEPLVALLPIACLIVSAEATLHGD
jgi:hypothetical protein